MKGAHRHKRRWSRHAGLTLAGTAAVMTGVNTYVGRPRPLPPRLSGEQRAYTWRGYHIAYAVHGTGTPLLLVHSINAAASSFEMHKQWTRLVPGRRLYALDLLGFGGSDRPDIAYNAELYTDLLIDFTRDVIGSPVVIVTSSMSGSFAVAAAARLPEQFTQLIMSEPTGLTALTRPQGIVGSMVQTIVRSPFVGTFLFNLLASRPSIRFFLANQSYHNPAYATPTVIDRYVQMAHQPGARFAPAAFLSGALNSNVRERFAKLRQPVLIAWGVQAQTTPFTQADAWFAVKPQAKLVSFEQCGDLPHDEAADAFANVVNEFLTSSGS